MAYRDRQGIYFDVSEWIQMALDKGVSPKDLMRALEAQMAGKSPRTQADVSLAGALATTRRDFFQNWYRELGFNLPIPFPPISDQEFNRRKKLGQALFYRPPTPEVSYEALMKVVGQGEHWTVTDKDDREKIVREPTKKGYWFWAEVAESCPRLGTSWNDLTKKEKLNLLSLEEYVLVWWAHKADTNFMLDTRTWSWLRTRFGRSALAARESAGRVRVCGWVAGRLSYSCVAGGGRSAEVVKM